MLAIFVLVAMLGVSSSRADDPSWTTAATPFRIAGNLYYVGSEELAAYLVVTPQGDILINSNLESSPKQIRASVEKLGFRWSDVKILLISQGHFDHCAGSAEIVRETGAKYEVMAEDVSVVESGGHTDFHYANDKSTWFPPVHVDRALRDGDTVTLGGTTLVAHKTAGHNKGTTTWTMDVREDGRTLHAVIVGGPNVNPGYKLVGNAVYPQIADDFARGFAVLKSLPCDLFLGAHASYFGLEEKYARFARGDKAALIDPAGYRAYVADRERAFGRELDRQKRAEHVRPKPHPAL
ncbi:MAG: subclass B3 metallo-beta-lactamase [Terracidiphilus sp.]|nr:subclass B3 metallo-beta-lactamase [Terracidiphilus sp.]